MIRITDLHTKPPQDADREELEDQTKKYVKRLEDLHRLIIANGTHSVLVIFQGMDASGKDGAVRNVFSECTHNGFRTYSFKKPTDLEFAHDFLWRVHQQCPAKGELVVFNRSHYEDVLIQRVHGWISEDRVQQRMKAINAFEELLINDNNTLIFKFFLNISFEQQAEELQQRIDEPDKHYKHNPGDWEERKHWDEYMRCYQDVINGSSVPWHIIPVDSRWYRDYLVSKALVEGLEALNMTYPPLEKE
jgi:PPK2 family polyphosphate:nucleotide phosphotransferase